MRKPTPIRSNDGREQHRELHWQGDRSLERGSYLDWQLDGWQFDRGGLVYR